MKLPCNIIKMLNKHRKKYFILLVTTVAVFATYEFYDSYVNSVEMEFYKIYFTSHTREFGGTCKLPDYDPFDPTILKYITKWPPIACGKTQMPLTYLDQNGCIHLNKTAFLEASVSKEHFHCMYQEVKRTPNDDFNFKLGAPEVLIEGKKIFYEYIVVQCYDKKRLIYESGHIQVTPLTSELDKSSKKVLEEGGVNILILALDSLSRLNFIRQLPKTYKIITQDYKAVVIKGLTKVGDNTFPNMMVMLSGLAIKKSDIAHGPIIGNASASKGSFDHYPILWKNCSQQGYVTMYTEDEPDINLFSYRAKGFYESPTDFYTRPFWLALEKQRKFVSSDSRCYAHLPKHAILWNYTEEFINKMHQGKNAYFLFSFSSGLSHDKLNSVQVADDELAALFTRLYNSGAMENTFMLVMGDHGNRFDTIRKTVIGRVEERMPFLAVHLPQRLELFREHVETNSQILTSWHDIYETLMDVIMKNTELESRQLRYGYHGLSLFRPIPSNRTCRQVGIPEEYCICQVEKELNPQESRVIEAGHALIKYVNILIQPLSHKCAKLTLDSVISGQLLLPPGSVTDPSDFSVNVRVTVVAKPSGALLEATTERNAWDAQSRVVGDVNRINQYGNESACIDDRLIQLYCFCKTNTTVSMV